MKCVRLDFVILDSPTVRAHTLLAYTLSPPSTSTQILFFKEDSADKFCEFLSIREPQTTLQIKETTVQSHRKMSNQNTKKSPGIEFTLFNYTGDMEMNNSACLNSSLFLILFCNEPAKKYYDARTLTVEPPPIGSSTLLAGSSLPLPSVHTLCMTPDYLFKRKYFTDKEYWHARDNSIN